MTKKGGKKGGKAKNKGGSGGGGKKVVDTTPQNVASTGHQVEDRSAYVEGEPEKSSSQPGDAHLSATATAPEPTGASKTPSAAPPQVTHHEDPKKDENATTGVQGEAETKAEDENNGEGALLTEKSSRGSIQDAVDKVQASKSGRVSVLDAGPSETGILPEVTKREQQHLDGSPSNEPLPDTKAPKEESEEQEKPTASAARTEPVVAPAETIPAPVTTTTTLPERTKEQKSPVAEEEDNAAGLSIHAKRPYETSLFAKEEAKPPKIPKVGETVGAQPSDDDKTDLNLLKTGSSVQSAAAPATTPDVAAKELSKNELPTDKAANVPSEEASGEYLTAPAAKAETLELDVSGVSGVAADTFPSAGSTKEVPSAKEPSTAAAAVSEQPQPSVTADVSGVSGVAADTFPSAGSTKEVPSAKEPSTAAAAVSEQPQPSVTADVSGVSGVAADTFPSAGATKEVPSAKEPSTAAAAVSEQPQTSVTPDVVEDLAPAPVSAPNSVAASRDNSADSVQVKDRAPVSSSDSVDTQSRLKEEELKKAEERVENHQGAMKNIMVDDTNPEVNKAQREEAKEEEARKEQAKKEEAKEEQAKNEEAKEEAKKEEPKEQQTKDTNSKPAGETEKQSEENKAMVEKAKEAAEKAKESAKEDHKKGGLWSWLKRKIKGA